MNLKFKVIFLCFFISLGSFVYSQNSSVRKDFYIYLDPALYGKGMQKVVKNSDYSFKNYYSLIQYNIDRRNSGKVDLMLVKNFLSARFPRATDRGFIMIDWEGDVFGNYAYRTINDSRFQFAESQFKILIDFIKEQRPNVKVGIYGLPFRNFESSFKSVAYYKKFSTILRKTDFICPSIYIPFPNGKNDTSETLVKLKDGLKIALDLAGLYNKPVIPCFWDVYYPYHLKGKFKLMNKTYLEFFLRELSAFSYNNRQLDGIIWWEPGSDYFNKRVEIPKGVDPNDRANTQSRILEHFFLN